MASLQGGIPKKKQNKTGKDFDENGEKPEKRKKNLRLDKGGGKLRRVSCVALRAWWGPSKNEEKIYQAERHKFVFTIT